MSTGSSRQTETNGNKNCRNIVKKCLLIMTKQGWTSIYESEEKMDLEIDMDWTLEKTICKTLFNSGLLFFFWGGGKMNE